MTIYEDGSFFLAEGEAFPFLCTKCGWPKEYDRAATVVECEHCGHTATAAEFSEGRITLVQLRQ
jgi:ribosomal protein S27E